MALIVHLAAPIGRRFVSHDPVVYRYTFCLLHLQLPTDPTSTPAALGLWVLEHAKAAADELGGEVDGGAVEEGEGDCVYEDVGGF
jgi:hypothetical protein